MTASSVAAFQRNTNTKGRTCVVEAVHPGFRVRLGAVNRTNVVRLAEVVPCDDLKDIKHVTVGDDALPPGRVEVRVRVVNELKMPAINYTEPGDLTVKTGETHVLVVRLGTVVRKEPGADSTHIRRRAVISRHRLQSVHVLRVRVRSTDELAKRLQNLVDGLRRCRQQIRAKRADDGVAFRRGQGDGPPRVELTSNPKGRRKHSQQLTKRMRRTHVEHPVDRAVVLTERSGIDKEGRHEVDGVRPRQVWMLCELGGPAFRDRSLAERAALSGERRGEDASVDDELVGVLRVRRDVVSELLGIVWRGTRHNTGRVGELQD